MHPTTTSFLHRILRPLASAALALALAFGATAPAVAHHGWTWAEDASAELTGTIVSAKLGNPHGELILAVEGANWIVEVGQPWRNERAGLKDDMLVKGVKLVVTGNRHSDPKKKVLKAVRLVIDGRMFNLYPERS
jgi:Family of unknown function (DUF6152)